MNRFIADPMGGNLYVPLAARNDTEGSWTISTAPLNDGNLKPFMGGMAQVLGEIHALYGSEPFRFARLPGEDSECSIDCSSLLSTKDYSQVGRRYQFTHEPSMAVGSFSVLSGQKEAFQVAASYESRISTGTFVRMERGIIRRPDQSLVLGSTLYTIHFSNPLAEADHESELRRLLAIDAQASDLEFGRQILMSLNANVPDEPTPVSDRFWKSTRFKGTYQGGEMTVTIARAPDLPLPLQQVILEISPEPVVAPLPASAQPIWNLAKRFTQSDEVAIQWSNLLLKDQSIVPGNKDDN